MEKLEIDFCKSYEPGDLVSVFLVDMLMKSVFKLGSGHRVREGDSVLLKVELKEGERKDLHIVVHDAFW